MLSKAVSLLFLFAVSALPDVLLAGETEDSIIDNCKMAPVELLLRDYAQSKVLLMAEASHHHFKSQALLAEVIRRVGDDPNLRFIALERTHEAASFYEAVSVQSLEGAIQSVPFPSERAKGRTLCFSPEWAYTFAEIFPLVQRVNLGRPKDRKLIVLPIDGNSIWERDIYWPNEHLPLDQTACRFDYPSTDVSRIGLSYTASAQRNFDTAGNFADGVWKRLKPGEKAIVLYHYSHLLKGFQSCFFNRSADGAWRTLASERSWFSHFLTIHPEAERETRLVVIDELEDSENVSIFKLTARQSRRHPNQDFAIDLSLLGKVAPEVGTAALVDYAFLKQSVPTTGSQAIDRMADGLIWSHDSSDFVLAGSNTYLPQYCAGF